MQWSFRPLENEKQEKEDQRKGKKGQNEDQLKEKGRLLKNEKRKDVAEQEGNNY